MATKRRNSEDQDSSIKSRANEVFSDAHETGPIKPFAEYLRETPPTPLSIELKALLWVVGFIIALLFFAAFLRIQRGARRPRPVRPPAHAAQFRSESKRSSLAGTRFLLASAGLDPAIHDRRMSSLESR